MAKREAILSHASWGNIYPALDGEATIKLLEAINDIKNDPLPARYRDE